MADELAVWVLDAIMAEDPGGRVACETLHHGFGALAMAPLYDLMSTLHYGDDRLAMSIDTVQRTDRVTAKRIANEAVRWGLSGERATSTIADLLESAPAAIAAALEETDGVPDALLSTIEGQLALLLSSK
jgi:S-adenosylmethionine synthetase